uniref:Uncharacterized protein n=1 Tax=Glossina palpalis gambiensis TaxID=67801 RepID=A0A1B0BX35_9MUSC
MIHIIKWFKTLQYTFMQQDGNVRFTTIEFVKYCAVLNARTNMTVLITQISSAISLYILILNLLLGDVFSLHCHKCDSFHQRQCSQPLYADKYLMPCPHNYHYCGISRLGNSTQRGCMFSPICKRGRASSDLCCQCKIDGCNSHWTCLGQKININWFAILVSVLTLCLLDSGL